MIALELWTGSKLSRAKFGFGFVTSQEWDPAREIYGALPYIFGTMVTSLVALLLAGPRGNGGPLCLGQLAPNGKAAVAGFLGGMLAASACGVYGVGALFFAVPSLRLHIEPV